MPELDIIFISIITIIVFSIVFSIAAWIFLAKIASKTNLLEREIEKRSLEFDALKKERMNERNSPTGASVIESPEIIIDTENPTDSLHDTIQIFRNVRGTFEHSEQSTEPPHPNNAFTQPEPAQPSTAPVVVIRSQTDIKQQPGKDLFVNESVLPPPPPTSIEQIQTPQVDNKNMQKLTFEPVPQTITLSLYSEITKDADFQTLWKKITEILQNHHAPRLAIDLSDINFLYEKEMDYLEKINYLICNHGGSLTLINCEQDLLTLLNRKQYLGSIVTL